MYTCTTYVCVHTHTPNSTECMHCMLLWFQKNGAFAPIYRGLESAIINVKCMTKPFNEVVAIECKKSSRILTATCKTCST